MFIFLVIDCNLVLKMKSQDDKPGDDKMLRYRNKGNRPG